MPPFHKKFLQTESSSPAFESQNPFAPLKITQDPGELLFMQISLINIYQIKMENV